MGAGRRGRSTCLVLAGAVAIGVGGCGGHDPARSRPVAPAKAHRAPPAPRTDPAAVAARAHVPVLCWHQIRQPTSADGAAARPYIVSPRRLAEQMDALDRAGFTAVGGDALASHVVHGTRDVLRHTAAAQSTMAPMHTNGAFGTSPTLGSATSVSIVRTDGGLGLM